MTGDQEKKLDEILEKESGLYGNSMKFIEDLDGDRGMRLSEAQANWLDDIWDRVCG